VVFLSRDDVIATEEIDIKLEEQALADHHTEEEQALAKALPGVQQHHARSHKGDASVRPPPAALAAALAASAGDGEELRSASPTGESPGMLRVSFKAPQDGAGGKQQWEPELAQIAVTRERRGDSRVELSFGISAFGLRPRAGQFELPCEEGPASVALAARLSMGRVSAKRRISLVRPRRASAGDALHPSAPHHWQRSPSQRRNRAPSPSSARLSIPEGSSVAVGRNPTQSPKT